MVRIRLRHKTIMPFIAVSPMRTNFSKLSLCGFGAVGLIQFGCVNLWTIRASLTQRISSVQMNRALAFIPA